MEDRASKIEQFIKKREELKKSPVPKPKNKPSVFKDKNPRIKSLEPKTKVKDIIRLTPERFKQVQSKIKAKSAIKSKLNQALKSGDKEAAKAIVNKVGEVAKKTGKTELLADLIKRVSKSSLAKGAAKKVLSAIPLVGGIGAAISSGDIKAAVPGLDYIDDLGPKKGSLNERIEKGTLTPKDIKALKERK